MIPGMPLEQAVVLLLSTLLAVLFFPYGFNLYFLARQARRAAREPRAAPARRRPQRPRPAVAVHLPLYNERYVADRLVGACARMARAYGGDRVRILVIDDSTDETRDVVDRAAAREGRSGPRIQVLRRPERTGFKAGALALALDATWEEYVAVFDADFMPTEDFLLRAVPELEADATVGIVQGRWRHLNEGYNRLTRAVAIGIDAHFLIEQAGRCAAGLFLNFNGSGGVLRRSALVAAGGWQWDTLAEDLDVSYRVQLGGWRVRYLVDLPCPAEIPPTLPAFRKQQARWACGSLRAARKLLPRLLARTDLPLRVRIQAAIHMTQYGLHPLMLASFLLACFAAIRGLPTIPVARAPAGWIAWAVFTAAIAACTLAPWLHAVNALRASGRGLRRNIASVVLLGLVGGGLSVNNTVEAVKALATRRSWGFERTPKYAVRRGADQWKGKGYQVSLDPVGAVEGAAVLLGLAAAARAAIDGRWGLAALLAVYTVGFAVVGVSTLAQSGAPR